jgi:hypothetical protein
VISKNLSDLILFAHTSQAQEKFSTTEIGQLHIERKIPSPPKGEKNDAGYN